MISSQELKERQQLNLNQKIDHSLGTIEQFMNTFDEKAYVSFSGGKDSTVLLHLVRRMYPNVRVVFLNTTNEFPEIYNFVKTIKGVETIQPKMNFKQVIAKYGFPLISKEQSQYINEAKHTKSDKLRNLRLNGREGKPSQGRISKKWQFLINQKFDVTHKCCEVLKKAPAKRFEKKTGLKPIIGTMADESRLRLQKYLKTGCNSFESKRPASYPLSIWTDKDIWEYIEKYNVDYCSVYDDKLDNEGNVITKGETQTGCMFCGFGCHLEQDSRFEKLKINHNRAYDICMNYQNNGVTFKEAIKIALQKRKGKEK